MFFSQAAGTINNGQSNANTISRNRIFGARRVGITVTGTSNAIGTGAGQGNFVNEADIAFIAAGPIGTQTGANTGIGSGTGDQNLPTNQNQRGLGENRARNVRRTFRINPLPFGTPPVPPVRPEGTEEGVSAKTGRS